MVIIMWLLPLAGKMKRILFSDWPLHPSKLDGPPLPALDFPLFCHSLNESFIVQAGSVKMI